MLETNKIYNEDCMETMRGIDNDSVNLVLADPPYSFPVNQFRPEARILQKAFGDFSPYQHFFRQFVLEIKRILKEDGNFVVFCNETFYPVLFPVLYENFYATKLIIWDKQRIGMGGIWRRQFELLVHSYLRPQKVKSGDGDIVKIKPVRGKTKLHNSQKPVDLTTLLIEKLTVQSDLVYDPFIGSGTTAISAIYTGRNWFGSEISVKYFDIASKRIQEITRQGMLRGWTQ